MKIKTLFILILIIILGLNIGCSNNKNASISPIENGNQVGQENEEIDNTQKESIPEEDVSTKEPETTKTADPISTIDISLVPNEIGEIMILMYHGIGEEESVWQRNYDNFRQDLEYMYQNKYQMLSLNDYARGNINTKAGCTPIILTFDDGRQNNFDIIEKDGNYIIDPNCAVGILEEFKEKYSDFNVTASFFLNTNPFGQEEYTDYKLKWLIENGYDVGNHTYSHNEMETLNGNDIVAEIGSVNNIINKYVPDYAVETLALPHGSNPKEEYIKDMMQGEYERKTYKNIAVLDVGWRPAYSPFDLCADFTSLYRVTASEINVDNCGMYDYFNSFENGTREKFISDGNLNIVTIPKRHEDYINMDIVGDKVLNIYE